MSRKIACALFAGALLSQTSVFAGSGADLAIGFDKKTQRPNAFIAWRNSARILEVEVEVKNLGDAQGEGKLHLALVDEYGRQLASSTDGGRQPQKVRLPPRMKGGEDGKIVQVIGTLELNLLIDKLDRANQPYTLKAWIEPTTPDIRAENNVVAKSFNVPSRVSPGASQFHSVAFRNYSTDDIPIKWSLDTSTVPAGWSITSSLKPGLQSILGSGQTINGYISLVTPEHCSEGDHVDVRLTGRNANNGDAVFANEWYAVFDTTAPRLAELRVVPDDKTGYVRLTAQVDDGTSMLKEASGVRIEYSTDGGVTFSSRTMEYEDGNFVGPTSFRTQLGPFAPGASVVGRVVASDIAANAVEQSFGPIRLGRTAGR